MTPPERARAALAWGAAQLGGSATPRLDAELLLAHAAGITREALLLGGDRAAPAGFAALIARRAAGEPLAYITGTRDFWDMTLAVAPGVLIPRPDSETLIEAAIGHFAGTPGPSRVLDLGTGSGALLFAALRVWPGARGIGVDRSWAALTIARANAMALGLADRATLIAGDWAGTGAEFDLLLCNPPYIATGETLPRDVRDHEPHEALFAGADGLDAYRVIVPLLAGQIAPGGAACLETGAGQAAMVSALVTASGLRASRHSDLGGHERCIVATR